MKYNVISKRTGNVKTLLHSEVNDMDYDSNGRGIRSLLFTGRFGSNSRGLMAYDLGELSKIIGFHRKHQRVPMMKEVELVYLAAKNGDIDGALRLLDWKRHCFYVKDEEQRAIMARVFECASELIK
ncbi:hypothetical protein GC098_14065 [Paenibacillus sp. LMG 31458]|uniref:Uncharacterized protein n=1 Tax=Paenibacillus phytorum TaxID=2654977 RepID=A0ABX1XVG2_9BACL|nr:hypothetical protein [Paenibacillus phytorum]NOU72538.1 hypothetical protein [Paenibacillus phytorum]